MAHCDAASGSHPLHQSLFAGSAANLPDLAQRVSPQFALFQIGIAEQ
jgi:hypothetical protein